MDQDPTGAAKRVFLDHYYLEEFEGSSYVLGEGENAFTNQEIVPVSVDQIGWNSRLIVAYSPGNGFFIVDRETGHVTDTAGVNPETLGVQLRDSAQVWRQGRTWYGSLVAFGICVVAFSLIVYVFFRKQVSYLLRTFLRYIGSPDYG